MVGLNREMPRTDYAVQPISGVPRERRCSVALAARDRDEDAERGKRYGPIFARRCVGLPSEPLRFRYGLARGRKRS